jgi:hypothetical protein
VQGTGGSPNRLQSLTTTRLHDSASSRNELTDLRANAIAASYGALVEKGGEIVKNEAAPTTRDEQKPPNASLNPPLSASVTRGGRRQTIFQFFTCIFQQPCQSPSPLPVSSMAPSTRSSSGNPFQWNLSPHTNSVQVISTSFLKGIANEQQHARPRARTDPAPMVPTSISEQELEHLHQKR